MVSTTLHIEGNEVLIAGLRAEDDRPSEPTRQASHGGCHAAATTRPWVRSGLGLMAAGTNVDMQRLARLALVGVEEEAETLCLKTTGMVGF